MTRQTATQTHQQKPTATPTAGGLLQRKCACGNHTMAGGECAECKKKKRLGLQTKLKINEPGDIYEQEADRLADQVMAMPAHSAISGTPSRIQRLAEQRTGQTEAAPASVDQVLASPGRPLEPELRRDMEQRFGHDFSRVRVHSDAAAEQSAQDLNAKAYTVGHDIVFGAGPFSPEHPSGRRLLAHELAHVVQQAAIRPIAGATGIQRQARPREDRYIPPSATAGRLVYAEEIFQQSPEVRPLSDANFTNIFYDRDKLIVVDFWASWCRPCDDAAAHVAYLARRFASGPYAGRVKFYHVQLEDSVNPQLNKRFGFDAIPVVYFYFTGTGRQPSRQAPLLEGSIQGGDASVEDYEWRIWAILGRHGLLVESTDNKTGPPLQRYPSTSKTSEQSDVLHRKLTIGESNAPSEKEADRIANQVLAGPGRLLEPAVAQQRGSGPGEILLQRQPAAPGGKAPRFGKTCCLEEGDCEAGTVDPCQRSRCSAGDLKLITGDLTEALNYVGQALQALHNPTALSDKTRQALDWFFGSQEATTVQTIKERLGFIQHCLRETLKHQSFGCDPDEIIDAYTCIKRSFPIGQLHPTNICMPPKYLNEGDARQRATSILHECGHRIGLTLVKSEDIYSDRAAFRLLGPARALRVTESYAEFAAAIAKGVETTLGSTLGLSFGRAFFPGAPGAWLGRLYFNVEPQHPRNRLPVVSWVNPTIGIGVTMIGESTTGGATPLPVDKSLVATLILGARFGDPRPGKAGSFSLSTFVAPGLSTQLQSSQLKGTAFGIEAGVVLDYRWKWLHVSVGASAGYDGIREAGLERFYTLTGSVGIDGPQIREWFQ